MAPYVDLGQQKPNAFREVVAARYELCEDMATMLAETAKSVLFSLGTEEEVLAKCHPCLLGEDVVVSVPEAAWVIRRLAELLDWYGC